MTVAVLFARADSHYKALPDVDVWDIERDARKWSGGSPVVAHPPCRSWGRLAHMAKPRPDEKYLARLVVAQPNEKAATYEVAALFRLSWANPLHRLWQETCSLRAVGVLDKVRPVFSLCDAQDNQ